MPLFLSAGKPSTLVSKNGGKTPTTPSGKLKGKMLAARKVRAPQTSSSESGSEDNDEDFVANPKEEKRRKVVKAKVSLDFVSNHGLLPMCSYDLELMNLFQTRKKTPSKKDSAAEDEKPHYPPERDANQNTLFHEPSNWMQVHSNGFFNSKG